MQVAEVLTDLLSEQAALDDLLMQLTEEQWGAPTASPRWDVTDQVAHLTFFDQAAATAISDETAFEVLTKELWTNANKAPTNLMRSPLIRYGLGYGERISRLAGSNRFGGGRIWAQKPRSGILVRPGNGGSIFFECAIDGMLGSWPRHR